MSLPGVTAHPKLSLSAMQRRRGRAAYERAWRTAFERYHPDLTRHFRRRLQNDAEADEVVAETWDRAVVRIDRWSRTGSLGAWLRAVGEHVLRDRRRAAARAAQRDLEWWRALSSFDQGAWAAPDVLARLAAISERQWLERRLTANQRDFIGLRVDQGLSHVGIATLRGLASPKCAEVAWPRICARARKPFAARNQPAPATKRTTTKGRPRTPVTPQTIATSSGPTP